MEKLAVKKTVWDLTPLFKNDDDKAMPLKRKYVEEKNYAFINKWKDRTDYLIDPKILTEAIKEYELLERDCGQTGDEGFYFDLRTSQDQNDPIIKAKEAKITDFGKKLGNDIQFFGLRLARVDALKQKEFLDYPGLKDYRHHLEMLFASAKYLLSEPEEKILTLKSTTSYANWVKMTSGFLAKEESVILCEDGKKETKNFSEIMSLIDSKKKKVRDSASQALNRIIEKHIDAAEAELNSILEDKKTDDEIRGLKRPDSGRHISDDIDSSVVDSLLDAVSSKNDIARRYYRFKAKMLKVKKLEYHERNVPYGNIDKKYSYEEALNLVYKVFTSLDSEFAQILKRFNDRGQIDVFPKKGKQHGAFCAGSQIRHPVYVLLNHDESLNDVLTLAHEMGHAINDELMKSKQNSLNYGTPLSTAEVASTFMEDFVLDEILKGASDELRLSIMMMKLNADVSTIFRQVACYKFEQELHKMFREKGYLPKEEIGKIFQKHMSSYMGDSVEKSPGSENWWVFWPHIRHFFYVYSYASGLLISKSMQASVKKDKRFISKVKDFLSSGESDSPKNIFLKLGIDIADKDFWYKGIGEIDALLDATEKLAKKMGKI